MIYFIRQRTLFKTRIKIGFTEQSVSKRLGAIKGSNPNKLDVLLVLPGDKKIEDIYHNMFEKYQVHREWYRYGFWLKVFILVNKSKSFQIDDDDGDVECDEENDENINSLDQMYREVLTVNNPVEARKSPGAGAVFNEVNPNFEARINEIKVDSPSGAPLGESVPRPAKSVGRKKTQPTPEIVAMMIARPNISREKADSEEGVKRAALNANKPFANSIIEIIQEKYSDFITLNWSDKDE